MMINYCHISPVSTLHKVAGYNTHLLLAHLVEENEAYRNFYIDLKKKNPGVFYHLDNSAFEKFKRGEEFYNPDKLMDMARLVSANSIVMSDYPKEPSSKTIEAAKTLIPKFKSAGFQTFFCPQSELGDIEGLISSFDWAIKNRDIDFIGVSILACPIALGINEQKYEDGSRDESYRMQRYLARWRIFEILRQRGMLDDISTSYRFHCLGMTDGPREIDLLRQYHKHIFSWDSSSPIWHGINNIHYDHSPTGLIKGKYEEEVDFDIEIIDGNINIDYNMAMIDSMCGK
jgi:hypothetical protein